jgi:putative transposase
MPLGLKRHYGSHHLHFITCSCYQRLPLLGTPRARNTLVKALGELRRSHGFALIGYVVMPEHIHLLIGEPARGTPSTVLQLLKQRVSRMLRPGGGDRGDSPVWTPRFYDFNVWSTKKKNEKLGYMHTNPVKRGLVTYASDWAWSSYSFYARDGECLIAMDTVPTGEFSGRGKSVSQNPHP